jgi:hypothetical protein
MVSALALILSILIGDPAEVAEKSPTDGVVTLTVSSSVIVTVLVPASAAIEDTAGALESITSAELVAKSPADPKSGRVSTAELPYKSEIVPVKAAVLA